MSIDEETPARKATQHKLHTGPFAGRWAWVDRISGQGSTGVVVWRLEGDEGRVRRMRLRVFRVWVNPKMVGRKRGG